MDLGIFNARIDVNACDCTRGCTDTVEESAPKVDWQKNPLPHQGTEPASTACRSDALPTELHPHPADTLMLTHQVTEQVGYINDPAGTQHS